MVTTVKNNEIPDFAGDYVLKEVIIINHIGKKIDVKNIMTELNIYESILLALVSSASDGIYHIEDPEKEC